MSLESGLAKLTRLCIALLFQLWWGEGSLFFPLSRYAHSSEHLGAASAAETINQKYDTRKGLLQI